MNAISLTWKPEGAFHHVGFVVAAIANSVQGFASVLHIQSEYVHDVNIPIAIRSRQDLLYMPYHFEPLAAHVLVRIREGERIFADETTLPTLNPGAGKTKTRSAESLRSC